MGQLVTLLISVAVDWINFVGSGWLAGFMDKRAVIGSGGVRVLAGQASVGGGCLGGWVPVDGCDARPGALAIPQSLAASAKLGRGRISRLKDVQVVCLRWTS